MTLEAAYLGVDIGSSGTRVVALGSGGKVQAVVRRSRPRKPMVIADLERSLDLERIWSEVESCLSEVAAQCGEVRSLGVCAMRQTLIALADDDAVLFASGNDDLRASLHGAAIDAVHGDALMRQAGRALSAIFWPGKLAWLESEATEVTERARKLTTLESWIVRRLTGAESIGPVSAGETGARSIPEQRWLTPVLPDWTHSLLPPVADDAAASRISATQAQTLGLPEGLPVAMGAPDTHATELGSRRADLAGGDCVTAGWSLTTVRPQAAWDAEAPTWRGLRIGGGYLAESNAGDVASGYAWLGQDGEGELTDLAQGTESAAERGIFAPTGARAMDVATAGLGAAGLVSPVPLCGGIAVARAAGHGGAGRYRLCRAGKPRAPAAADCGRRAGPIHRRVRCRSRRGPDPGERARCARGGVPRRSGHGHRRGDVWRRGGPGDFTLAEAAAQLAPAPRLHQPDPSATRALRWSLRVLGGTCERGWRLLCKRRYERPGTASRGARGQASHVPRRFGRGHGGQRQRPRRWPRRRHAHHAQAACRLTRRRSTIS